MNKKEVEKQLKDYPAALTVKETAEILRVSTKLVYRIIRDKTLPATKVGREKRIAKSHLIEYIRAKDQPDSNPKCVCSDNTREKSWTSNRFGGMCVVAKTVDADGNQRFLVRNQEGRITCLKANRS